LPTAISTIPLAHGPAARRLERLEQCSQIWIEDGETLVSIACGGGGYGDPKTRDMERVLRDVAEGLVSRERAADVYRVIITEDMEIAGPATQAARAG
jgi:N-methylhydantoinase B